MNQNEIWLIDLEPSKGAEMQKTRPAVIVNDNRLGKLPLKIIVPITDWKSTYEIAPWMVKLEPDFANKLSKTSAVDCFQIRSVAQERLIKKIGEISSDLHNEIKTAIKKVLSI
ncbi:MAG: type II toxin-antitoxin system PemK/MazF family toxin [Bacteroidetes bacterium]|nr:type II toxin-antitoxin system PemK/MazF family toxin [Bacteroidota bacterium]